MTRLEKFQMTLIRVEFVLAPQHEMSCDVEITTKRRLRLLEKNN